jgi:hypothetical protein
MGVTMETLELKQIISDFATKNRKPRFSLREIVTTICKSRPDATQDEVKSAVSAMVTDETLEAVTTENTTWYSKKS